MKLALVGLSALGALLRGGCDQGSSCPSAVLVSPTTLLPTSLTLVRERAPREVIIDTLVLPTSDAVVLTVSSGLTLRAEIGRVQSQGNGFWSYQPPPGTADRLWLSTGTTDRGWVAVRIGPRPLARDCGSTQPRVQGFAPAVHARITAPPSGCSESSTNVTIHQIRPGQMLEVTASDRFVPAATEITSPAEGVVGPVFASEGVVFLRGARPGWAAVHLVDPNQCRHTVLIEVTSGSPTMDAGTDAGGTDAGGADAGGTDAGGIDAGGIDAGFDAGHDAPDVPDDDGVTTAPVTSFPFVDVIPFGLVEFSGGLFWYDNGGLDLHRFDLATLSDAVVLRGINIALRDLVPGGGRLFWTTGSTSMTQVVAWRPGDAAPAAPLLSGARVFDQVLGDGTSIYAHEQGALQWMLNDGTMPRTALSSSGQRGLVVADGRLYFADLGLSGSTRGVFRVALTPPPSTLLGSRETVVAGALVEDDAALPQSLLVDGAYVYGLGLRSMLRARLDGTGTPTQIARFPKGTSLTAAWTRMCLARGRMYMVDQATAGLWSVPVDGSAPAAVVATPTGGIGFSIVCASDSVWWWSGPRLNRYRLP